MKQKLKTCFGISSLCKDGNHVIYYDSDCNHTLENLKLIEKDLRKLQTIKNLSTFYLIKSTHGYNAFCLDKLPVNDIINLLSNYCSMIDDDFIKYGAKRKYFTLRVGNDKISIRQIISCSYRQKSYAHKIIFEDFFNYSIEDDIYFDKFSQIDLIRYESEKDGYFEVS